MDLPPHYLPILSLSANVTQLIWGRNIRSLKEERLLRPPSTLVSPKPPLPRALVAPVFVMFFSTFFRPILLIDN